MHLQLLQLALICLLPPFLLPVSSSCATNLHRCHSRVRGALSPLHNKEQHFLRRVG